MRKPCHSLSLLATISLASISGAQSPTQHIVVPPTYATDDAISHNWLAGASRPVRQQTLVGQNHLTAMLNKHIKAIEFRRSASNGTFLGGKANMVVSLSTSTSATHEVSSAFANNIDAGTAQEVFNSTSTTPEEPVVFPTSPPSVGPSVDWIEDNVVRIEFQTPFFYTGGRLCIDITGTPIATEEANWWMADAECEDIPGIVTDLNGGCGTYATSSYVSKYSLVVGGYAKMTAYGTPGGFGFAMIGDPGGPVPVAALGFAPPGNCNLMLNSLLILQPVFFDLQSPGRADFEIKIPNLPGAQGLTLATQWFDWTESATTNALQWTITSAPSLDMALVEGHPAEATGNVAVELAHVIRFEYQ